MRNSRYTEATASWNRRPHWLRTEKALLNSRQHLRKCSEENTLCVSPNATVPASPSSSVHELRFGLKTSNSYMRRMKSLMKRVPLRPMTNMDRYEVKQMPIDPW